MKKTFLIILLCQLLQVSAFSQEHTSIRAYLKDSLCFDIKENMLTPKRDDLRDLFKKYEVVKFKFPFPKVKNDYLKKVVTIESSCCADELEKALKKDFATYFADVEIIKPVKSVPDYDPSDYMWVAYRDWLWHLTKIEADAAWDITHGSSNVSVAVIDQGFDISHPDLATKINPPYDPLTTNNFGYIDEGHGTCCASFVAAETDGGGQLSSIGFNTNIIAYDYDLYPPSLDDILYHAAFEMNVDVISLSYSTDYPASTSTRLLIQSILNNGTIIVRSAGNTQTDDDNTRRPLSHSVDERIIIVSSTDNNDNHTNPDTNKETHANYPEVDICAPGYQVMGAERYDNGANQWPYYGSSNGTSFATPIVAGVCALMKSINPCITVAKAQEIIKETADPIADENLYSGMVGAGRINAYESVKKAGTIEYIDETLSGTHSVESGYAIYLENVTIGANSNITLTAKNKIDIDGTFSVPIGSTFTINIDPNASFCE